DGAIDFVVGGDVAASITGCGYRIGLRTELSEQVWCRVVLVVFVSVCFGCLRCSNRSNSIGRWLIGECAGYTFGRIDVGVNGGAGLLATDSGFAGALVWFIHLRGLFATREVDVSSNLSAYIACAQNGV